MKKVLLTLIAFAMLFTFAQTASAATLPFVDMIDSWGIWGDAVPVWQVTGPFNYQHDINDQIDLASGDYVVDANLELDFTNDVSDAVGVEIVEIPVFCWTIKTKVPYNFEEYARVAFDGSAWIELGEVDNGQYDIVVDIATLNDNGILDVTLDVYNDLGYAGLSLDHSKLSGNYQPVPEPATMTMGLMSLAGLYIRRKFF